MKQLYEKTDHLSCFAGPSGHSRKKLFKQELKKARLTLGGTEDPGPWTRRCKLKEKNNATLSKVPQKEEAASHDDLVREMCSFGF